MNRVTAPCAPNRSPICVREGTKFEITSSYATGATDASYAAFPAAVSTTVVEYSVEIETRPTSITTTGAAPSALC